MEFKASLLKCTVRTLGRRNAFIAGESGGIKEKIGGGSGRLFKYLVPSSRLFPLINSNRTKKYLPRLSECSPRGFFQLLSISDMGGPLAECGETIRVRIGC